MSRTNQEPRIKRAKHKAITRSFNGLLARNPVLASGLALAPVVVAATTVKTAVALGITMTVVTLPTLLLAAFVGRWIPAWLRTVVYALTGALLLVPAAYLVTPIAPTIFDSMGMYFSLMAVNSILLSQGERIVMRRTVSHALLEGLGYCLGFLLAAVLVGAVRELLISNTFWGLPVNLPFKATAFSLPFAGFLVVGMLAGTGRFVRELAHRISRRKHAEAAAEEVAV